MQTLSHVRFRSAVIGAIRSFFSSRGFLEVHTPLLVPSLIPESHIEVFATQWRQNGKTRRMFLSPSPEAAIKQLLSAGIGNCFEITRSFRNEQRSPSHVPEFTILEWYRIDADYTDIMEDCRDLLLSVFHQVCSPRGSGTSVRAGGRNRPATFSYQTRMISLSSPWKIIPVSDALSRFAGCTIDQLSRTNPDGTVCYPLSLIRAISERKGYHVDSDDSWEQLFHQIFLNEVEPHLARMSVPVILFDYPLPLSSLARIKPQDPRVCERFELSIAGVELANCFSELTDYGEQQRRSQEAMRERARLGKTRVIPNRPFLASVRSGLPECSGIALGVDRLLMLLSDSASVCDVSSFSCDGRMPT